MPHAASTGQSCTLWSGGGVVVAPCSNRGSSSVSARANASRPFVASRGARPSRHTLRQLSMIHSPVLAAHLGDVVFSLLVTSYTFIVTRLCLISSAFSDFYPNFSD